MTEIAFLWPGEESDPPESFRALAVEAGIDTTVCEFCEEPLDDEKPWRRGLDGCGAHEGCLGPYLR